MTFGDKTLVGDFQNGNVYQMDLNTFTDNGDILPAIRQAAHEADESNHFIFYHKFWLDMEVGIGLNSGLDPQVVLDWSNDGGSSFLTSRQVSAGKIGERLVRAIFRRLGRARDRVWRITVTDPVKRIFIKSDIEATLGTA